MDFRSFKLHGTDLANPHDTALAEFGAVAGPTIGFMETNIGEALAVGIMSMPNPSPSQSQLQVQDIAPIPATGGFSINLIYDAAALAAPASFRAGIQQAANLLAATITDHITVNLKIDYSGTGGGAAAGPDQGLFESYSLIRSDLINNATPGDTIFNALPSGSSIQGQTNVAVWNAQLKLFGLLSANDTTTDDGSATFATDINPNLLVGVALHELTHAMGRIPYGPQPDIFDFFRFTSLGTRLFQNGSTAPAAYFSVDGGITKLADYGQTSDSSDFLNSGVQGSNDPFNEFYNLSSTQQLSAVDIKQLDALGYHVAAPVLNVIGGPGNDTFVVTSGPHHFDGGGGENTVDYSNSTTAVNVNLATGGAVGFGGNDTLINIQNVIGSAGNDTIIGDGNNNLLIGGAGNDIFVGGTGNDGINGGVGNDTAAYSGIEANYLVRTFLSAGVLYTQVTDAVGSDGNDTLMNVENLIFYGSSLTLHGAQQNHHSNIDAGRFDDVVFQNSSTGQVIYANMTANGAQGFNAAINPLGTAWNVVGSGDINSDGFADVVIRDNTNGNILYGAMGSGGLQTFAVVATGLGTVWKAVGVADINGDGYADVVVQNTLNGNVWYANMAGGYNNGYGVVTSLPLNWNVVGTGDFNGDGFADVLFRDANSSAVVYANMASGTFHGFGAVVGSIPADWAVRGTGDVSGDGSADVIFQNVTTGATYYANMVSGNMAGWGTVLPQINPTWTARGAADVNNDGHADVLFENSTDGSTVYADMTGGTFHGFGPVSGPIGHDWIVV